MPPPLSITVPPAMPSESSASPPASPPPITPPPSTFLSSTLSGQPSFSSVSSTLSSRNDIFSSKWKVAPAFAPPPLPLSQPTGLADDPSDESVSVMTDSSDGKISVVSGISVGLSGYVGLGLGALQASPAIVSQPPKPSIMITPSHKAKTHQKSISTSSTSSRTSSFFDTPMLSPTPPPPPSPLKAAMSPPAHVVSKAPSRPKLNQRTSSCPSIKTTSIPPSPSPRSGRVSFFESLNEPSPTSDDPSFPTFATALNLDEPVAQHPIHSLRLAPSSSYLLGRGANSNVYLSSFQPQALSVKGKERAWTLAAAKIPIDENGVDGGAALRKEGQVLRWIGSGRKGLVSSYGAVSVCEQSLAVVRSSKPSPPRGKHPVFSVEAGTLVNETFLEEHQDLALTASFGRGLVLLLEYCSFGTIDSFVKAHPELITEELFVQWVGELASGGEWLEARGVVHRDIKPQNILLTSSLQPRLTDFDNALFRPSLETTSYPPFDNAGSLSGGAGTTSYSSPELLLSPTKVSYPSDVFSLGASLYVIINRGKQPYQGVSGTRELCFWVSRGGFWDWEERNRTASVGDLGQFGLGAFRRGGSLREHGKGAAAPFLADTGERAVWDAEEGGRARVGEIFGKRAARKAQEAELVSVDLEEEEEGEMLANPIVELLSSVPCFHPLSAKPSSTGRVEREEERLPGVPMHYPSSTPYSPHEVGDSTRRLIKSMLDPMVEKRPTMKEARVWALGQGWNL